MKNDEKAIVLLEHILFELRRHLWPDYSYHKEHLKYIYEQASRGSKDDSGESSMDTLKEITK